MSFKSDEFNNYSENKTFEEFKSFDAIEYYTDNKKNHLEEYDTYFESLSSNIEEIKDIGFESEPKIKIDKKKEVVARIRDKVKDIASNVTKTISRVVPAVTLSAVGAVAIVTGSVKKNATIEYKKMDIGCDYINYEISAEGLDEEKDYRFVLEATNEEYILEFNEGDNSGIVSGLSPYKKYTLSLLSESEISLGYTTVSKKSFYTLKPDVPTASLSYTINSLDDGWYLSYDAYVSDYYKVGKEYILSISKEEEIIYETTSIDDDYHFRGVIENIRNGEYVFNLFGRVEYEDEGYDINPLNEKVVVDIKRQGENELTDSYVVNGFINDESYDFISGYVDFNKSLSDLENFNQKMYIIHDGIKEEINSFIDESTIRYEYDKNSRIESYDLRMEYSFLLDGYEYEFVHTEHIISDIEYEFELSDIHSSLENDSIRINGYSNMYNSGDFSMKAIIREYYTEDLTSYNDFEYYVNGIESYEFVHLFTEPIIGYSYTVIGDYLDIETKEMKKIEYTSEPVILSQYKEVVMMEITEDYSKVYFKATLLDETAEFKIGEYHLTRNLEDILLDQPFSNDLMQSESTYSKTSNNLDSYMIEYTVIIKSGNNTVSLLLENEYVSTYDDSDFSISNVYTKVTDKNKLLVKGDTDFESSIPGSSFKLLLTEFSNYNSLDETYDENTRELELDIIDGKFAIETSVSTIGFKYSILGNYEDIEGENKEIKYESNIILLALMDEDIGFEFGETYKEFNATLYFPEEYDVKNELIATIEYGSQKATLPTTKNESLIFIDAYQKPYNSEETINLVGSVTFEYLGVTFDWTERLSVTSSYDDRTFEITNIDDVISNELLKVTGKTNIYDEEGFTLNISVKQIINNDTSNPIVVDDSITIESDGTFEYDFDLDENVTLISYKIIANYPVLLSENDGKIEKSSIEYNLLLNDELINDISASDTVDKVNFDFTVSQGIVIADVIETSLTYNYMGEKVTYPFEYQLLNDNEIKAIIGHDNLPDGAYDILVKYTATYNGITYNAIAKLSLNPVNKNRETLVNSVTLTFDGYDHYDSDLVLIKADVIPFGLDSENGEHFGIFFDGWNEPLEFTKDGDIYYISNVNIVGQMNGQFVYYKEGVNGLEIIKTQETITLDENNFHKTASYTGFNPGDVLVTKTMENIGNAYFPMKFTPQNDNQYYEIYLGDTLVYKGIEEVGIAKGIDLTRSYSCITRVYETVGKVNYQVGYNYPSGSVNEEGQVYADAYYQDSENFTGKKLLNVTVYYSYVADEASVKISSELGDFEKKNYAQHSYGTSYFTFDDGYDYESSDIIIEITVLGGSCSEDSLSYIESKVEIEGEIYNEYTLQLTYQDIS